MKLGIDVQYLLADINGIKLVWEKATGTQTTINVSKFSNGIYILKYSNSYQNFIAARRSLYLVFFCLVGNIVLYFLTILRFVFVEVATFLITSSNISLGSIPLCLAALLINAYL